MFKDFVVQFILAIWYEKYPFRIWKNETIVICKEKDHLLAKGSLFQTFCTCWELCIFPKSFVKFIFHIGIKKVISLETK